MLLWKIILTFEPRRKQPLACGQALHLGESREVTRGTLTAYASLRVTKRHASLAKMDSIPAGRPYMKLR